MGGRYFITGSQLGMLMSVMDEKEKLKLLQDIIDFQYIGDKNIFDKLLKCFESSKEPKKIEKEKVKWWEDENKETSN